MCVASLQVISISRSFNLGAPSYAEDSRPRPVPSLRTDRPTSHSSMKAPKA